VRYNFVADIMGLSSFVKPLLPSKIAKSREISTQFDLIAVQSHPRSSIYSVSQKIPPRDLTFFHFFTNG